MTGFLFLLALTSLSASPILVKWAHAPVEFLGFWRLILAGIFMLTFELFRRGCSRLFAHPWPHWKWPLITGVFFFLHLWTYVFAAQNTSVAHLVILFSSNPVFTTLGAVWFFKEKLKSRLLIVYPLAFAGIWILAQDKIGRTDSSALGDMMAVLSAALHAAYFLCSKKARKNFENIPFSIALYLTAGVLFGISAVFRSQPVLINSNLTAWGSVFGLILFPTFLGHALLTQLVGKMDLSLLSCGKLLEPGLSSAMAYFFFAEKVSSESVLAFTLTAAAVLILFWPQKWMPA